MIHLEADSWITRANKVQKLIGILADERFQVVTSNIVPFQAIIVEIVQDRQARFIVSLCSFTVVWLWGIVSASVTPIASVAWKGRWFKKIIKSELLLNNKSKK